MHARVSKSFGQCTRRRSDGDCGPEHGYSLVELVVTIAIIGVIAAVAIPSKQPTEAFELSAASTVLAGTVRFARDRAIQTGVAHGIDINVNLQQVQMFRVNDSSGSVVLDYNVLDPLTKRPYRLEFGTGAFGNVEIENLTSAVNASCAAPNQFVFDAMGVVRCPLDVSKRFTKLGLTLNAGSDTQSIYVNPVAGRVYLP